MLSDESSSNSETGRFKCRAKSQDEQTSNSKTDNTREAGRSRQSGNDRFTRNLESRREDRYKLDKYLRDRDRDRQRFFRHSPISRRKHSRDRSSSRKSRERNKHRDPSEQSKLRDHRSNSKDRHRACSDRSKHRDHRSNSKDRYRASRLRDHRSNSRDKHRDSSDQSKLGDHRSSSKDRHKYSKSKSNTSYDNKKSYQEDLKCSAVEAKSPEKFTKKPREKSFSPGRKSKRSEIYIPPPLASRKAPERKKSESPIIIDENDYSDTEVQHGSYYKMIPAVVKEKSDESTDIDSSDDERLRAKLLKREVHDFKKQKKHKKKHKRKSSKSSKDRDFHDTSVPVEVSSTTDIKVTLDVSGFQEEAVEEVTSTQKIAQKDSCEEGEISSDDSQIDIDPTDLRYKLRRSAHKSNGKAKTDICGPALPPHLDKLYKTSASPEIEGPALPPHLQRSKNLGPSIPDDMRKVLAERECEAIGYESSDEDNGIGPLPAGSETRWSDAHRRLEERALDIKIKNLDGHSETKVKSREKWMLELPEGKAKYLGLEARSFRAKEGPDMSDRSSWTDTPQDKARKAAGQTREVDLDVRLKEEARIHHIAIRDDEQESAVKKHKKKHKRDESLLEMHQKKLKKKKKKEEKDEGKKERRPFSRDVDLQVNRFDEAQKKSIIKKAQDLNSRFGRGEAKYL